MAVTDAERLAKAMQAAWEPIEADNFTVAQRLIDSGVVTVNPPPDPAEQIADAWRDVARQEAGGGIPSVLQRLIDDGWIVPGPRCDQ